MDKFRAIAAMERRPAITGGNERRPYSWAFSLLAFLIGMLGVGAFFLAYFFVPIFVP